MSLGSSLLKTVDTLLNKFNATDRAVYKRLVTRTGGDALLGRPGSVTTKDTLLNPCPAVSLIDASAAMVVVGSGMAQIGDYVLTISPTAMSRAELQSSSVYLVFKAGTAEEELQIIGFNPMAVNGMDVAFDVVARSKKR